jgi:large repetitive protein
MFHTRGQATTRTPTTGASATGRPRSILLVLALLAALGAPLAAAAPVGAQAAVRLELTPAKALTDVKKPVRYTAELVDANGRSEVTSRTTLQATGPAPCHQDHDKLSCDDNGSFEVTGILYDPEITSEPVVLEVVNPGVAPTLGPPPPDSPPNREVRVRGHTGSCNQDGTLSSTELKVDQQVTGIFTATIRIPSGTFPGIYPLSLDVPCDGKPQGATVQITVSNRPPDAVNDVARATPGGSVRIPVTDNDTDPDGEDGYKSALEADPPTVGTADPAGQVIVYTPGPGFVDRDQFTYRNCDVVDAAGKTDCGQATVVVTREDPVPKADQAGTKQGKEVPILVTENDTSPDPAKLRVRTDPKHGTAVVKEPRDGHIVYTPEEGFADEDTFEYDYCEGVVVGPNVAAPDACPFATVTVTVEPGLPEPEAVDDPNERTERDKQVDIDVMANDGHPVAARLQVLPEPAPKGTAVPLPNGMIRYTPEPGATGKDSFQYDYCKPVINLTARAACAPATVTVVIRPPVEITKVDPNPTPPNKEVVVEGTTGFCQEGTLTLRIPPDKDVPAAVTANQDGAFTARLKVPQGTFVGPYGLVLRVNCDGQAREAQEKLVVANKAPDAVDDLASTPRDTPVTIPVTGNDTDPDGDDGYKTSLEASQPANGRTKVLSGDRISYTPNPGFTGEDPFTYRLCDIVDADGRKDCDTATVTATVVGRRQPVPVDDPDETTVQDQPVVIEVMKNDRDPDASLLQVKPPARPGAKAEEQPGGTVRYTPEAGFTGTDTFTYDYCGGSVDVTAARAACPSATVTVSVTSPPVISSVEPGSTSAGKPVQVVGNTGSCNRAGTLALQGTGAAVTVAAGQDAAFTTSLTVPAGTFPGPYTLELRVDCKGQLQRAEGLLTVTNQAPVAADDVASTTRDQPVRIRVTNNDRDPDDPDSYRALVLVTRQPDHGTAEPQPDQTVVYTPQRGFVGTDRLTYSLCDDVLNAAGRADCGTATVTVTVTDTPVISSVEPASTSPGKPVRVVGNTGSCSRAGTLTFSGAADLRMSITSDQNGGFAASITVPDGTFPRPYRLRLDVDCKGQVQRAEAELTVANQAPVAVDDEITVSPDTPTSIDVTGNDRDPDDPDTYRTIVVVTRLPDQGTAKEGPDQSIIYTPGEGFVGTDRFEYSLCDDVLNAAGQADCGTATVTVRTSPVACAPSERDNPSLRVEPERGSGGTRLRITAAVDRKLATCQLRLLLGGTPLTPDVTVGDDGSISAERGVPPDLKPGPNLMRLATMTADTLAEAPFEVVGAPPPPPLLPPWLVRILLSAGALAAGFLARAAFRRWGKPDEDGGRDRTVQQPDDLRAEPHARPAEVTVEPVPDNTRTLAVRLEPHPDPGIQTIQTLRR